MLATMNATAAFRFAPGVRLRQDAEGGAMLLVPEGVVELNPSAAAILQQVDGTRCVRDIARTLAATFDASEEELDSDVRALCGVMFERGFLIQ